MQITRLALDDLGLFDALDMELAHGDHGRVTVLVGNNGAGKTTVLQAMATALSWWVARVRSEKGSGKPILDQDIANNANRASIAIEVAHAGERYHWNLAKARRGRKQEQPSVLLLATHLAEQVREQLSRDSDLSVPLVAFYPCERGVLDIPLKIRNRHQFGQLDGLDNALNQGVDFRRFFEWFREREDIENESGISQEVLSALSRRTELDPAVGSQLSQLHASSRDQQLQAVRRAIAAFMPGFDNLRVKRKPRLHMAVDKHGQTLDVAQLSQGEKSLLALVGDIARRLAMMNPALEDPLHGEGIVLIDEIELHLHPRWQRGVISRLSKTFPHCQFVLTTHSPAVISDSEGLRVFLLEDGELRRQGELFGEDVNTVLADVMDAPIRNEVIEDAFIELRNAIQDQRLEQARTLLLNLQAQLPANNLELSKAQLLLRKMELRHAKDR